MKVCNKIKDNTSTNVNDLLVQNDINYYTPQEADPRLIRNAIIQAANWLGNITIQTVDCNVLVLSPLPVQRLIQAGMKAAIYCACKISLIWSKYLISLVGISARCWHSFMPSVDATHHPVLMARESLLSGMHGCLTPSQQNLPIHLLKLATVRSYIWGFSDLKLKDKTLSKDALLEHMKQSPYQAGWL